MIHYYNNQYTFGSALERIKNKTMRWIALYNHKHHSAQISSLVTMAEVGCFYLPDAMMVSGIGDSNIDHSQTSMEIPSGQSLGSMTQEWFS